MTELPRLQADPFWRFSCEVYARPGVAEACLSLQDSLNLNVNVLLFCLWWGLEGGPDLDAAFLDAILDAVEPWHDQIVGTLRRARRASNHIDAPLSAAERSVVHDRLLALEIECEHAQQLIIARTAEALTIARPRSQATPSQAIQHNVSLYLQAIKAPLGELDGPLGQIVKASLDHRSEGAAEIKSR